MHTIANLALQDAPFGHRAAGPIGRMVADPHRPDTPITYMDPVLLRWLGYTAEEVLGRNARFLQGPDTEPEAVARLRAAIADERPVEVLITNHTKAGVPFRQRVALYPQLARHGGLVSWVSVNEIQLAA